MPNCFIIMPITTPSNLVQHYGNDKDHFRHVLNHLFVPAIKEIGYTPIPPSATGSDLIHAEIIKILELDELVLCDMSSLNSNVFFELGIRTALDKPTCLVRDKITKNIPFDTGIINHHTYEPSLVPWMLDNQITALIEHLTKSIDSSSGRNTLWKYFGLTKKGESANPESPIEEKLDLIIKRISIIEEKTGLLYPQLLSPSPDDESPDLPAWIVKNASVILSRISAEIVSYVVKDKKIIFNIGEFIISEEEAESINRLAKGHGYSIEWEGTVLT